MLLAENTDAGTMISLDEPLLGMVWWQQVAAGGYPPPAGQLRINEGIDQGPASSPTDYRFARPSSKHPGGFVAAFCDKSTRFIREDIDYWVYAQLLSSNGPGTRSPQGAAVPPAFQQVLTEGSYK
jgi:hypothetical protein